MKRNSPLIISFLMALILGIGVGCAKKPDDTKISSEIQSKFSQDSGLGSKQLAVKAEDGVVTLSGRVDNDAQREAAGKQAASIAGVKTVINNLEVSNIGKPSVVADMAAPAVTPPAASAPAENSPPPSASKAIKASKSSKARHDSGANKKSPDDAAGDSAALTGADGAPGQIYNNAPPPAENTTTAQESPPPPAPKKLIIDQGTQLTVRLIDAIDSEKNQTGDTFHATLNAPLTSDGEEAVPAGVELVGHLIEVKSAGKFAGQSSVVMQLDSLTSGGKTYNIQTDQYSKKGSSRGKNTAEKVGAGAAIGGIIGAIAGGGKGAAIGAAAGAGVGGGVQAAGKSQQIKLPSETVLNFTLQQPVTVVQAAPGDANRQRLTGQQ
ncbi:MAG TPA: BON domain-containing protein [Candidatus Sulfotelmatobacter sp.]|nr:BON domain-containing protein [Candidatus Sulfotelmatobacter sp.]